MNCKQGDLAFIVGAKLYPEINGLVVRCIGARGQERKGCHRGRWNCYAELRKTPTGRMQ